MAKKAATGLFPQIDKGMCGIGLILMVSLIAILHACSLFNPSSENDEENDGEGQIQIVPKYNYSDKYPAVRPGFNQVAFYRERGNDPLPSFTQGLYLVDIETKELEFLAEGSFSRPNWLDESTIIVGEYSFGGGRLHLLNIHSGSLIPLNEYRVQAPSINRTDSTVVYEDSAYLWLFNLRNGKTSVISTEQGFWAPSWSPDGFSIAVEKRALSGNASIISIIESNGSLIKVVNSTEYGTFSSYPSWNNSGSKLVYEVLSQKYNFNYMIIIYEFTTNSDDILRRGRYPVFDNSGVRIIYSDLAPDSELYSNTRIYICSALKGGSEIEQVTY